MTPFTRASVDRTLLNAGGMYDFEDILEAIGNGSMQSHCAESGDWVVTKVVRYPRKLCLEIILAVGTLNGLAAMEPSIVQFAREHSCELLIAWGRVGWEKKKFQGWKKVSSHYLRSVE